jgi:hypothetical protein
MLINWFLYPLLMLVASAGHGLLIRRLVGRPFGLLLLPVGFALMIVVTTFLMTTGLHGSAWLGIVVPAALGFAVSVRELPLRRPEDLGAALWPAGAALLAFALFAAPVVLTWRNTFTGFTMITDIANHFDLTARLVGSGHEQLGVVDSSYLESVRKLLGASYPTGMHSLLGSWSELLGREIAWMYQPTISFAAPMAALSAFALLRWAGLPAPLRAAGAAVVVMPNLLFSYGLAAGFKELFAATMILTVLAVLADAFTGPLRVRRLVVVVIPLLAGYDAFAGAIAPWMGIALAVFALTWLLRWAPVARHVTPVRAVAASAVLLGLAALLLPSIKSISSLASNPGVNEVVTSQTDLGNLAKPLDPLTSVGIWLTGDYRFPLGTNVGLTHALVYLTLALAGLGAVSALWRRRPELVGLLLAAVVPLIVVLPETGPWVDAKIFAITGTLVLTLAFFGIGALTGLRRGIPIAAVLAAVVGGGVLYGNALAIHNATLAPERRLAELERIGHEFAGQGPALAPSFDEYAEYFLRDEKTVGRVNPPSGFPGDAPQFGADLDQVDYDFVKTFPLIILRRDPARSRPPSNYRVVKRTRFYDVWKQVPGSKPIFTHVPLGVGRSDRTAKVCRDLARRFASDKNAVSVAWARADEYIAWEPLRSRFSPNWPPNPAGNVLSTHGPGRAYSSIELPQSAEYRLWLTGSFERPLMLTIDGRTVATLSGLSDYPGETVLLTTLRLAQGRHAVEIRRGGGSLVPGNGDVTSGRSVGPLYLEPLPDRGGTTFETPVADTFRTCRTAPRLDWVELLGAA